MQLIPRHDPYMVVRSTGGVTVAALRGELDLVLVRHLRPELDALVRESDALTVDIRRLTFCDATGLGLLAHCAGRTRQRGARWRLVCDQPWILRLIRLTDLDDVLCPERGPEGELEGELDGESAGEPEGESAGVSAGMFPEGRDAGLPGGLSDTAAPRWDPAVPLLSPPGVTRPVP
ncbi:STAS domain-containing protein [Streptomyces sp. TX20-6-3]|uniref:STAS domain-containing protein n=1 Tax=Streptomyces sp. TX20-6-3 TaxID=3028705 RepID=UPI0029B62961|nr:STAS domain-containing protein [Streptomyces sp. TX20-6-3]MDX2560595.1 STAS domain-containing protein [Streptomyces sp. TX20-6-3]